MKNDDYEYRYNNESKENKEARNYLNKKLSKCDHILINKFEYRYLYNAKTQTYYYGLVHSEDIDDGAPRFISSLSDSRVKTCKPIIKKSW